MFYFFLVDKYTPPAPPPLIWKKKKIMSYSKIYDNSFLPQYTWMISFSLHWSCKNPICYFVIYLLWRCYAAYYMVWYVWIRYQPNNTEGGISNVVKEINTTLFSIFVYISPIPVTLISPNATFVWLDNRMSSMLVGPHCIFVLFCSYSFFQPNRQEKRGKICRPKKKKKKIRNKRH